MPKQISDPSSRPSRLGRNYYSPPLPSHISFFFPPLSLASDGEGCVGNRWCSRRHKRLLMGTDGAAGPINTHGRAERRLAQSPCTDGCRTGGQGRDGKTGITDDGGRDGAVTTPWGRGFVAAAKCDTAKMT